MSMLPAIFKKRTPNEASIISVPDIKDYLVKEYERVNELKHQNELLEAQIENAREVKLKYDATLVTLDEYSKRLQTAKIEIQRERERTEKARQEADRQRDLVNSYKIQFNNAALTKEQIRDEIISEVKNGLIEQISNFKGNLSKTIVREIIAGWED